MRERLGTLALVLALGLPITAGAVLGYRQVREGLIQLALQRRESVAALTSQIVRERFGRLEEVAESLAADPRMRELAEQSRWQEAVAVLATHETGKALYQRVFLADRQGVLRADHPALPDVRGEDFSHRDWYQGASERWQPYVSKIYVRQAEPQIAVVAVAAPIHGVRSDEPVGLLVLQVPADSLASWVGEVDLGVEAATWIADTAGNVIPADDPPAPEIVARALAGKSIGRGFASAASGEDQLVSHAPIASLGWATISQQPLRAALAPHRLTLRTLAVSWGTLILATLILAVLAVRERERWRQAAHKLAEVNQELSAFTYSVSHDLRAPLRAISGFADMIAEDSGPRLDDEGRRQLGVIRSNVARMEQLIDGLLALSRAGRQALEWATVDMEELARETVATLSESLDVSDLELQVQSLPPATGDRALLRQVLFNLVSNAVKFSRGRHPAVVEVAARRETEGVVYSVSDNGVGFDMEHAERLFEVFERLHPRSAFEGSGVGLAIVERIVRRHGGRVWADARPDRGATFYFTLGSHREAA